MKDAARLGRIRDHAAAVRNRRFVLVSPPGAAGRGGRHASADLDPQDSPDLQARAAVRRARPRDYRESELNLLLGPTTNLLVVQDRAGHGVIVLKGIDTTGDQISVTRVADEAHPRDQGDLRELHRRAEHRRRADRAQAADRRHLHPDGTRRARWCPSTDGKDPAFVVDVYSTQQDFAQGIVRIDIAVRPVRAIDYIYATIRVKN